MMHGAGWMEGGLHASLEKFVLDADLLAMVADYLEPIVVDESTLAFEAIQEVGPAGHFFGTQHTQDRFRDAFYKPLISDWRNYESWEEAGKPTADQRPSNLRRLTSMSLLLQNWTQQFNKNCWSSSNVASPRAAWQPIFN